MRIPPPYSELGPVALNVRSANPAPSQYLRGA